MIQDHAPSISIASADFGRLQELALRALTARDPVGHFLFSELERATVETAATPPLAVRLDEWVTFRADDGAPRESRVLVLPENFRSSSLHLSVLSPLGAALIGLRPGARMPYRGMDGASHVATVESLSPPDGVVSLRQRRSTLVRIIDDNNPDDDGPTAA
jgi:regulator of nucleoside diphosphate kinase